MGPHTVITDAEDDDRSNMKYYIEKIELMMRLISFARDVKERQRRLRRQSSRRRAEAA